MDGSSVANGTSSGRTIEHSLHVIGAHAPDRGGWAGVRKRQGDLVLCTGFGRRSYLGLLKIRTTSRVWP